MKLAVCAIAAFFSICFAVPVVRAQAPIPLWTGAAPGALGSAPDDIPTLTPYLPDPAKASGAAMVICPGGGYSGLSMDKEGSVYARWMADHRIAG